MINITIRNVGNMWRVVAGDKVIGFATTYRLAVAKRDAYVAA